MRTSPLLGVALICFCLDMAVYGQSKKDSPEEALLKAKEEFLDRSNEIEVKLILALEQRIDSARKAGDKIVLDQAVQERDEFKADGTLPKIVEKAVQTFQRQTAAARKKLELTYQNQIKEYVKKSEDDVADALQAEWNAFSQGAKIQRESQQLIKNGDFERVFGDATKKRIWIEVKGKWERLADPKGAHVPPQSGVGYAWPTNSPAAELTQQVDLGGFAKRIDDGHLELSFAGYARGMAPDLSDSSRIILELLDADEKVLDSLDSGEVYSFQEWKKIAFSKAISKGTRSIRVRLLSERKQGIENNSYFDTLSLRIVPRNKSDSDSSK